MKLGSEIGVKALYTSYILFSPGEVKERGEAHKQLRLAVWGVG